MNKQRCPSCGGLDIDRWPEDAPHGYCYNCKRTVQVLPIVSKLVNEE